MDHGEFRSYVRENKQFVADEPVEFKKQAVEVWDFRRITDHSIGIYKRIYLLKWMKASQPEDVNT